MQTALTPEVRTAKQSELTAELRKARTWILAVGLIMFCMDMIMMYVVYGDRLPSDWKTKLTIIDVVVLAYFVGMWQLAKVKPVVACVLALCGFWGLHLYIATIDPSSLASGIILKVLFTVALVNGIKSASRAQTLQQELLENVFA